MPKQERNVAYMTTSTPSPSSSSPQYGALIGDYTGRPGYRLTLFVIAAFFVIVAVIGGVQVPIGIYSGIQLGTSLRIVFAGLGLASLVHLYYGYGAHAQLFQSGFIISRAGTTTSGRWEEVAQITHDSQQNYTITLTNGKTVHIYGAYFGHSEQLGNAIGQMVAKTRASQGTASHAPSVDSVQ